jgi:RimJ/RimL family protein N-acetyltransferase
MPADPVLSTARLALRWLTTADAAFMLRIWNDTDFVRYVGDRGLRSDEEARLALERGPLRLYAELGYGPDLLTLKSTGEPIGICGLFRRDGLPDPDIGFALLPGYRGDGYANEAADAVIGQARDRLGLTRLTAIVAADNANSVRLIEKLGLRFEQVLRLGGDDREACLYAIDWQ